MAGLIVTTLLVLSASVVSGFNLPSNNQLGANAASAAKLYPGSNAAAASSKLYTGVLPPITPKFPYGLSSFRRIMSSLDKNS